MTAAAELPRGRSDGPDMTVIVPVWRHWSRIPALLSRIEQQTGLVHPPQVVIVNNEAPAPPPPIDLSEGARIVDCAVPGSYAARNAGAAAARGRWLVFTDADCLPEPGWLAAYAGAATGAGAGAGTGGLMAGPVRMVLPDDPTPAAIFDAVRGIPQDRYVARGYGATANLAVRADIFAALGGFDATRLSGGDAEFCRRAGRAGHAVTLVPGAVVSHPARADWASLVAKARRVKGGQVAAGPPLRRVAWAAKTALPPLDEIARYARAPHPARHRAIAATVRLRLWGAEVVEAARLLAGKPPERG